MTLRLTNHDRRIVVEKAITVAFGDRHATLKLEEHRLAVDSYEFIVPERIRKQANALPDHWLRRDTCLRFVFGFKTMVLNLDDKNGLAVPSQNSYCYAIGTIADEKLNERFNTLVGKKEDLEQEEDSLKTSLGEMLSRVYTLKQLREGWPEGEKFYEHLRERNHSLLPALPMDTINKALGLTQKEAS